jgi:hypothetical protein
LSGGLPNNNLLTVVTKVARESGIALLLQFCNMSSFQLRHQHVANITQMNFTGCAESIQQAMNRQQLVNLSHHCGFAMSV